MGGCLFAPWLFVAVLVFPCHGVLTFGDDLTRHGAGGGRLGNKIDVSKAMEQQNKKNNGNRRNVWHR